MLAQHRKAVSTSEIHRDISVAAEGPGPLPQCNWVSPHYPAQAQYVQCPPSYPSLNSRLRADIENLSQIRAKYDGI